MRTALFVLVLLTAAAAHAAGPMDLYREIRKAHDDYDLATYYRLSRTFLAEHPKHRAADTVRYDMAAQLVATNLTRPHSKEAAEAIALLRHAAQHARTENARFDAALLLLKFEPTDDPGAAAEATAKRFASHPEAGEIYAWALTELERRDRIDDAARWAERLLEKFPRNAMAERARRVVTRARLLDRPAPFNKAEEKIADAAGGKILLLDFWATWCVPCVQSLPRLTAFYEKHRAQGLAIVGVDMDDTAEAVDAFVKEHKVPWPMIRSGFDQDIDERFGIQELPTYVIIDQRTKKILATDLEGDELFTRLSELLE